MDYVKINIDQFEFYSVCEIRSENLSILARFLTSDVVSGSTSWKEWLLTDSLDDSAGNATSVDRDGKYILLSDLYSEQEDNGLHLKIQKDLLVDILDQWEQFCKTRPKEIIITREDGVIKMEAID